ncbi:MAG: RluA family pseudouridine synthase [Dehalococcoidia bacterium]|nr:RluA family pseudouridine synthase [Dehalococcoidia bacterium]MCB9491603.1 RluA family pseudouridine synthase [Dehalococcoidia bacterium]
MTSVTDFTAATEGRLDRAVIEQIPALSRAQARRLIEGGAVTVDGQPATKPGLTVSSGAQIRVEEPTLGPDELAAAEIPLEILYEDEETLVVNKQAGLVVHPREGVQEATLINAVRARYPEVAEIDDTERGGIVHRLDRDTSGVIALAKTEESQAVLKDQWRNRETEKYYLAIVEGRPDPAEGIIEAPLGPDPADPRKRAVVEDGQYARSQYRVLEQYGDEAALIEVRIFTGRTHQIRVHMLAVGNPILGDFQYGRASERIGRQALHAWRLGFMLVSNGQFRTFRAPLPDDMCEAIQRLRADYGVTPNADIGEIGALPHD